MEKYFRKIEGERSAPTLRNIDLVYMINLDERPEKFARCNTLLALYGVAPHRCSAVNGWKLPLEALQEIGVVCQPWMVSSRMATCYPLEGEGNPLHEPMMMLGRTYFCHCMSRGSIGIVLSHLSVLQDAHDHGYETIWVMEDDIDVIRDPALLPDLIDELDGLVGTEGWDILFTDRDTKNNYGQYVPNTSYAWIPDYVPYNPDRFAARCDLNSNIRKVGARFGAYSMIVRRGGMRKILDFIKEHHVFVPFDIAYTLPPQIRLFTVTTDVVSTAINAPSDNGAPNYTEMNAQNGMIPQ